MAPSQELEDAIYSPSILESRRPPAHRALSLCLSSSLYLLMSAVGYWIETHRAPEGPRQVVESVRFDLEESPFPPPPSRGGTTALTRNPESVANPPEADPPHPISAEASPPENDPGPATGSPVQVSTGQAGGLRGGTSGGSPGGEVGALQPPVFNAAYLNNPAPTYPAISRRLREQGRVLLKVLVGPDGRPERVELHQSSNHARLDEAALATVARWHFLPARRGGETLSAIVIIPIRFELDS